MLEDALGFLAAAQGAAPGGPLGGGDRVQLASVARRWPETATQDLLSGGWGPVWTVDLARAFAPDARRVGYSDAQLWRDEFCLRTEQRAIVAAAASDELAMVLRDVFLELRYAGHLFADADRRAGPQPRMRQRMALVVPPEEVIYETRTPAGVLRFDNDLTRPLVEHRGRGAATLEEIAERVQPSSEAALLRSVDALLATRQIAPVDAPHPRARACVHALNDVLAGAGFDLPVQASAYGTPGVPD